MNPIAQPEAIEVASTINPKTQPEVVNEVMSDPMKFASLWMLRQVFSGIMRGELSERVMIWKAASRPAHLTMPRVAADELPRGGMASTVDPVAQPQVNEEMKAVLTEFESLLNSSFARYDLDCSGTLNR